MMRNITIGSIAWLMSSVCMAADVGGVKLDDKTSVGGQELVLNGAGIRTRAMFKVYVGSLYLPAKASTIDGALAKGTRRIQLTLLRARRGNRPPAAGTDGMKETNPPADVEAVKAQTDQFIAILRSMG